MARRIAVFVALSVLVGCGQKPSPTAFAPVPVFVPATPPEVAADPAAPKPLLTFGDTRFRHTGYVTGLALHPDGKTVAATASGEEFIRIWDVATGKEVKRLFGDILGKAEHPSLAPRVVSYSADGKRLIVAGPGRAVQVLDPEAERRVAELSVSDINLNPITVSPDGTRIAALGKEGGLTVWEVETGKELRTFAAVKTVLNNQPPTEVNAQLLGLAFSPDGQRLVASYSRKNGIYLGAVAGVEPLAFHPAEGQEASCVSWPTADAILFFHFDGYTPFDIRTGAFGAVVKRDTLKYGISPQQTPEGHLIGRSDSPPRCFLFDPATLKPVPGGTLPTPDWISPRCMAVSRTAVAVSGGNSVFVYDRKTGKPTTGEENRQTPYPGGEPVFHPSADGKRLITSQRNSDDHSVRVWDAATGRLIDHLTPGKGWWEYWHSVESVASPSARWLACGDGPTPELTVWDVGAGKPALRVTHPNPPERSEKVVSRAAFEPVGFPTENELWVLDRPAAEFRLLELPSGKVLRTLAGFKDVWHVCLSPDGKRLAASGWEGIAVRSLEVDGKWEVIQSFKAGDREWWETEWCGNGKGSIPHPLEIGFTARGELTRANSGPTRQSAEEMIADQALPSRRAARGVGNRSYFRGPHSPDGRYLYTSPDQHMDKTPAVVVVEVCTHRVVGRLPVPCSGGLAVSPDGTRLYTSNADGTISVWDLPALEAKHLPNAAVSDYWDTLASPDPKVGYAAVRQLAADSKSAEWLRECYAKPRETPLGKLIADLGHADYQTREAATKTLTEMGSPARPELQRVVEQRPNEEAAERAERILAARGGDPYLMWAGLSLDRVREVRAVEVLERVGSPAAVEVLSEWAKGESPVRKAEAAAAVARMTRKR